MDSLSSPVHEPWRFSPGFIRPAAAKHRYRKRGKTERLQALPLTRKRNRRTPRLAWDRDEREDGRRLAYDPTIALPGEGRRPTPRLERQEAFRAPQTWDISDTDVVVDDAALYRLGILYDDDEHKNEHVREPGFCLDAIAHPEPIYSLRPAKRAKKTHDRRLSLTQDDLHLSIELLSTYLSQDTAIARFLAPRSSNFTDTITQHADSTIKESPTALLSIIYELAEGSTHELALIPAASDFPDLISDSEEEQWEEYEAEAYPSGDWAFVPDPGSSAGLLGDDAAGFDAGVAHIPDAGEETTNTADDAWIVLARDDS
ncbi:hypothetical protein F5X97DRAFT_332255 [Nemania serpens]|nr:hypothetical protein F5X97DRAFT_332255 [Nemania serpens]